MCLDKIRDLIVPIAISIVAIISVIVTYLILGKSPETFIAIATIALVVATIYIAYFNMNLWIAQDKPWLYFYQKESVLGDRVDLYVVNVGKGVALDVEFKVAAKSIPKKYSVLPIGKDEPFSDIMEGKISKETQDIKISNIKYNDTNKISYNQPDSIIQISVMYRKL